MKELIVRDDRELRRVERAIAAIELSSASAKTSRRCLLTALYAERNELLHLLGRGPARRWPVAPGARAA